MFKLKIEYILNVRHVSNATENVGRRWHMLHELLKHTPATLSLGIPQQTLANYSHQHIYMKLVQQMPCDISSMIQ